MRQRGHGGCVWGDEQKHGMLFNESGQLPSSLNYIWCEVLVERPLILRCYKPPKIYLFFFFFLQLEMRSFWTRCWRQILYPRRRSQQFSRCHRYRGRRQPLCWLKALSGGMCKTVAVFFFNYFFKFIEFHFYSLKVSA